MQFLTVKQTAEKYPSFTVYAIRGLIKSAKENGFKICMRRIGVKILINTDAFEKWIEEHKQ